MTTCTFAGHKEVYQSGVEQRLTETLDKILATDDEFVFYNGGMGSFDGMCATAVKAAKRRYPDKKITLILVQPYMSNSLNTYKEYYEQRYDEILIPAELDGVHYKSAIGKRNRWMVDNSQYLIAFVYRSFGGALTTLRYAERLKKQVFNIAEK